MKGHSGRLVLDTGQLPQVSQTDDFCSSADVYFNAAGVEIAYNCCGLLTATLQYSGSSEVAKQH